MTLKNSTFRNSTLAEIALAKRLSASPNLQILNLVSLLPPVLIFLLPYSTVLNLNVPLFFKTGKQYGKNLRYNSVNISDTDIRELWNNSNCHPFDNLSTAEYGIEMIRNYIGTFLYPSGYYL